MSEEGNNPLYFGFAGMKLAGLSPQEAWQRIHESCRDERVRAIFNNLMTTEHGRALIEESQQAWAKHGFKPPWKWDEAEEGGGGRPSSEQG